MMARNIVVKFALIKLILVQFAERKAKVEGKMANFIVMIAEKVKES